MSKFRRQLLVYALRMDMVLMVLSFGAATLPVLFRKGLSSFAEFLSLKIKLQNLVAFVLLVLLWHVVFSVLGLYRSKRLASRRGEMFDVVKATSVCTATLIFLTLVLDFRMVNAWFVVIFWATSTLLVAGTRLALRTSLRRLRAQGRNFRHLLIVGTNPRALDFASLIPQRPEWGYQLTGFADDEWPGLDQFHSSGFPLVCDFDGLPMFLRRNIVDEVVIALPIRSFHEHAGRIADMCEQQGIVVRMFSSLFDLKNRRTPAEDFDDMELITHYDGPVQGLPVLVKRVLDIVLSTVLLLFLAPLFALTAILIKLTSPGKVLFVQKRIGLNKRVFEIFKFRTMVSDAEARIAQLERFNEVSGPVFKIKHDPRITTVGRFLRKTSIDELPQLFNVLKGDMSLVGPRPLALRDYELFTQGSPDWQRCRFSVRPGITCLWQVNGRSSIPFEQWMELDQEYVHKWSLWLDLQILAKTIPAVLKGSGAA
jgi:exopolysaccharide biosynthesis polyprenyl glycosylphosphotransferase